MLAVYFDNIGNISLKGAKRFIAIQVRIPFAQRGSELRYP